MTNLEERREYWHSNKHRFKEKRKEYYLKNLWRWEVYSKKGKEKKKIYQKGYNKKLKMKALIAYSKEPPICACCGETEVSFLTLDHINNNGRNNPKLGRDKIYQRLKKENYPKEENLQVLCFNCNCGKQINEGVCPHQGHTGLAVI